MTNVLRFLARSLFGRAWSESFARIKARKARTKGGAK